MADIRVIELAKMLNVEVSVVQRAAQACRISSSGPASLLNDEDRKRIESAIKGAPSSRSSSGQTSSSRLTLKRPTITGGPNLGESQGGRTVTVEVRKRRHRPVLQAPGKAVNGALKTDAVQPAAAAVAAAEPVATQAKQETTTPKTDASQQPVRTAPTSTDRASPPTQSPARKATPEGKQRPTGGKVASPVPPVRRPGALSPVEAAKARLKENADRAAAERQRKSAQARELRRQRESERNARTARNSGAGARPASGTSGQARPTGRPTAGGQTRSTGSGPRTTIRKGGLTPAQIAASKAPKSSLRQIEKKISQDRADQRQQQRRPSPTAAAPGAPLRRSPSVAVAADPGAPGAAAGRKKGGGRGQQPLSRRRLTPAEKAARRSYAAKRNQVFTDEQEDRMARLARGGARRGGITKDDEAFVVREVEITDPIEVTELASRMAVKSAQVVKILFDMGVGVTINESIDAETAQLVVEEFGHKAKVINAGAVEDSLSVAEEAVDEEFLEPRPPVVVVMGHVDHGKTSILDALRKANVASGEAGGITQHIGAYMVKLESGERVVFVDTPGHEAFTSLRARGAELTDVAVLVVAADDGVMPQTVEALNHARTAGVPIIIAVNKMDKDGADIDKVKRQLSEHGVVPEDWGGDTIFVPVSAHTGEGLDDLLEMLALQTEILELQASPVARARGFVIESRLDKGRGPVATVLVQNGTFKKGDTVVVGGVMGRIRAIVDENAVQHRTAGPSIPFELLGLESVPDAGREIITVENERQGRDLVRYRDDKKRNIPLAAKVGAADMNALFAAAKGEGAIKVPVLIKGDVTGSIQAMEESLIKLGTDEVKVNVLHNAIGGIKESDVMLASASGAIIIGFNVRPDVKAKKMAAQEGVDIRFYTVIYDAIDEIKLAMAGKLSPDKIEKAVGNAEVREVFGVPKLGTVAGCYITDGLVNRKARVRVLRDSVMIYDGELASLRRFKDDVREVRTGYECGIGVDKFNDIKVGDTFEFYEIEEVAATL
ncbi:MAG: translation initiation factor IF-2 [Mariprofundales bacterium]|nr:translation initiation factor IF-2 [Mariprofundales bacterium]